ncbi:KEOPS complex subunit Pcc1 [Halosimplex marinum]|uniref:KEOPS complex subunit Pcc1 n=1 Tax=Halosimplex marinum TaxID=3396620 RepID=UPI003F551CAC
MDHEAVFDCEYPDAERARRVERSVAVEAGDIEGDRTTATLERDGPTLTVTVAAADLVALRAGCNTWLSLVAVAEDCGAAVTAD